MRVFVLISLVAISLATALLKTPIRRVNWPHVPQYHQPRPQIMAKPLKVPRALFGRFRMSRDDEPQRATLHSLFVKYQIHASGLGSRRVVDALRDIPKMLEFRSEDTCMESGPLMTLYAFLLDDRDAIRYLKDWCHSEMSVEFEQVLELLRRLSEDGRFERMEFEAFQDSPDVFRVWIFEHARDDLLPLLAAFNHPVSMSDLCISADGGDLDFVKRVIESELFDFNIHVEGWCLIKAGIQRSRPDMLQYFMSKGVSGANAAYQNFMTHVGSTKIISLNKLREQLQQGLKPNPKDLQEAIQQDQPEVLHLLLKSGGDPNAEGGSLMEMAVERGRKDMVELLIQAGYQVAGPSARKALNAAARRGMRDIAVLLVRSSTGVDPSILVDTLGKPEVWEKMIDRGTHDTARLKQILQSTLLNKNQDGFVDMGPSLVYAAQHCFGDEVKRLVSSGVPIDFKNNAALMEVVKNCNADMVDLFYSLGADLMCHDGSALYLGVARSKLDIVKTLLKYGQFTRSQVSRAITISRELDGNQFITSELLKYR